MVNGPQSMSRLPVLSSILTNVHPKLLLPALSVARNSTMCSPNGTPSSSMLVKSSWVKLTSDPKIPPANRLSSNNSSSSQASKVPTSILSEVILTEQLSPIDDMLTLILFLRMIFGLASSIIVTDVAPIEMLPHSSISSYVMVWVPIGKLSKVKLLVGSAVSTVPSDKVTVAIHVISLTSLQLSSVVVSIGLGTIKSAPHTHGPVDIDPSILGIVNCGPSTSSTSIICVSSQTSPVHQFTCFHVLTNL